MKISVRRSLLHDALSSLARVLPSRATLPALDQVLLAASDGTARLTATDLDVGLVITLPAQVSHEGATTIPAKRIREVLRHSEAGEVVIEVEAGRNLVQVGSARFELARVEPDDYPRIPSREGKKSGDLGSLPASDLKAMVAQVSDLTYQSDMGREALRGVYLHRDDDRLVMVATDGHRFGRATLPVPTGQDMDPDLVVPPRAYDFFLRAVPADATVRLNQVGGHLFLEADGVFGFARAMDAEYPDYRKIIPQDHPGVWTFDKDALLSVLKRVQVLASDQTRRVHLEFGSEQVKISAGTPDAGDARDECPVVHESGEIPFSIAVNAGYLIQIVSRIATSSVRCHMGKDNEPVLLRPSGSSADDADFTGIVMPLRIVD